MLQTVPETPSICADVDIFDGFGNSGMVPQTFTPMPPRPTEFKLENPGLPFDKRVDQLGSPSAQSSDNSPYSSPPMEFPGLSEYSGYPDLNHGIEFKREFDTGNLGLSNVRRTPLRSDSNSSFGMPQVPRSVPEYHLQRGNSGGGDVGISGVNELPPFRWHGENLFGKAIGWGDGDGIAWSLASPLQARVSLRARSYIRHRSHDSRRAIGALL